MKLLIFLIIFPCMVLAEAPRIRDIEMNEVKQEFKDLESHMASAQEKFNSQCLKSFGHKNFCGCLKILAIFGVNFQDYIGITSASFQELEEARKQVSKEINELYDGTIKKREQCANHI